jgi:PPM family protein phosphatase
MDRPPHLPPGTPVGEHYTVEGLVRLAEGRMFYLANDLRPDRETRKCWSCEHESTPRSEAACESCKSVFKDRRFLISARWDQDAYDAYLAFCALKLDHPGLVPCTEAFVAGNVLFTVVPYAGEGLMVDEASPLVNRRLLEVGQRLVGVLAYLHRHGVVLRWVRRANILIAPDNSVRLYDLEVVGVLSEPVPPEKQKGSMRSLGEILRRYCDIEANELADYMMLAEDGAFGTVGEFGRGLEQRFPRFSAIRYPFRIGGMSDVGLTRQLNEDNWGWVRLSDRAYLYVVADGMGGHDGGEVASALAVRTICEVARATEEDCPDGEEALEQLLHDAFQKANNTVKDHADERGTDMGTTMVGILVIDNALGLLANVGDSRGYLLRNGALHQVSRDHSLVQKMVEKGKITQEEARNHPHSNILLRTVGTERDIDIDIFRVDLEGGDKVLMCSDGLWGEVEDRDMESILNTYPDPRIAARELVRAAHHGGGKDNVTLMIVGV